MKRLIDEFFSPLSAVVASEPIGVNGEWSSARRRSYATEAQLGTGSGASVEVEDLRWHATLESALPLAGLAISCTGCGVRWAKSDPPSIGPALDVSLNPWVPARDGAALVFWFQGAFLPTLAVRVGADRRAARQLGSGRAVTGCPYLFAEVGTAVLAVVLLQGSLLKVGRDRQWQLRDELASGLPPGLRKMLTRGREGEFAWGARPLAQAP